MSGFDLGLAEALLDLFEFRYTAWGGPSHDEGHHRDPVGSEWVHSRGLSAHVGSVLAHFIADETAFEAHVTETGYAIEDSFTYGFITVTDGDGHIDCIEGALIRDNDRVSGVIVLEPPVIDTLVFGDGKCSLGDQVRLATYLVRLCCDAVSRVGLDVRVFGYAVAVLRETIRVARLEQGYETRNSSQDSDTNGDPLSNYQTSSSVGAPSGAGSGVSDPTGEGLFTEAEWSLIVHGLDAMYARRGAVGADASDVVELMNKIINIRASKEDA